MSDSPEASWLLFLDASRQNTWKQEFSRVGTDCEFEYELEGKPYNYMLILVCVWVCVYIGCAKVSSEGRIFLCDG